MVRTQAIAPGAVGTDSLSANSGTVQSEPHSQEIKRWGAGYMLPAKQNKNKAWMGARCCATGEAGEEVTALRDDVPPPCTSLSLRGSEAPRLRGSVGEEVFEERQDDAEDEDE